MSAPLHALSAAKAPVSDGLPEHWRGVWCGRKDGWMPLKRLLRHIEEGLAAYATAQPLRYRQMMRAAGGFPIRRKSQIRNPKSKIA